MAIDIFTYSKQSGLRACATMEEGLEAADRRETCWINLVAPEPDHYRLLETRLGVHELTIEDIRSPSGRSKLEDFDTYLFIVDKVIQFDVEANTLESTNLNILLFKNLLITSSLSPLPPVAATIDELRIRPLTAQRGAAFIMYRILDRIADTLTPVIITLDDAIEEIEVKIFDQTDMSVAETIFQRKTFISQLRRYVGPQREVLFQLTRRELPLVGKKNQIYLRDIYDQIIRLYDILSTHRDILQSALESHMTMVSNRTNDVMRRLSVVATVILPLGLLTGLYGMNFDILPGAHHPHGFWIFLAVCSVIALTNLVVLKLKKLT